MKPHLNDLYAVHNPDVKRERPTLPPSPFLPPIERDIQSLRDGTGRYSTPREDAILLGVCGVIFAILITLICVCIHYADKIDHWRF